MTICPQHQVEFKRRQGFSKKDGKPYDFESCPARNPDGSFCSFKAPPANPAALLSKNTPQMSDATVRLGVLKVAATIVHGTKFDPAIESHRAFLFDLATELLAWTSGTRTIERDHAETDPAYSLTQSNLEPIDVNNIPF